MSKKDRIAVAISALYLLWPIAIFFGNYPEIGIFWLFPLIAYWGYRFIKGDISFIKMKMED